MKKGFYTIMSAQFFSSLADNALFVAAVELLRSSGQAEWQRAALVPMFALFYVVLAPLVGAFADAVPKGKVMFVSNAIKVIGCAMMLFGLHPLLAYAVVGLGAAAYSPAKYGILTELLPPSQLVKANGWIEGLTMATTTLFWGVSGNLRYIVLAWAAVALGYGTTQASSLVGVVAIGTAAGAVLASMAMRLDRATGVIPLGMAMGVLVIVMNVIHHAALAAPFLIVLG